MRFGFEGVGFTGDQLGWRVREEGRGKREEGRESVHVYEKRKRHRWDAPVGADRPTVKAGDLSYLDWTGPPTDGG